MPFDLLHIFRNTPLGRETLMQSAYFCKQLGIPIDIYVPRESQFLMYFDYGVVTVDLDRSFLRSPDSAHDHAREVALSFDVPYGFVEPNRSTAGHPDLRPDHAFMCLPRTISGLSTKIGLGHIGTRVRAIVKHAPFPVLLPAISFNRWNHVVCFYGGSPNAMTALQCARRISRRSKARLTILTQVEEERTVYQQPLERSGVAEEIEEGAVEWLCFEGGDFRDNLYAVRRRRWSSPVRTVTAWPVRSCSGASSS